MMQYKSEGGKNILETSSKEQLKLGAKIFI